MTRASNRRPRALIVLSSAHTLPLSEPAGHPGLPIGFFLVELAAVLKTFEDDYDFIFATPDGNFPQLDVNGLALNFHAAGDLGIATARTTLQSVGKRSTPEKLRAKNAALLERRNAELALSRRHLGRIPVSAPLPKTDKEAISIRDEVVASFEEVAKKKYFSIKELIAQDRDPQADFKFDELAFVHMPGGHAPMVDFNDNPWMGELLHSLRERSVPILAHLPRASRSHVGEVPRRRRRRGLHEQRARFQGRPRSPPFPSTANG